MDPTGGWPQFTDTPQSTVALKRPQTQQVSSLPAKNFTNLPVISPQFNDFVR